MTVERGRWYPDMPPALPGETDTQYTDRLTGPDRPYDHWRNRQCSLGYHDECSDPHGERCKCPCHAVRRVTLDWSPDWVSPPGDTLRETLKALGISQAEAARRMGVSAPFVSYLLSSHKGFGPEVALKLEALTGVSGEFWARLWAQYTVGIRRQQQTKEVKP